MAKARIWRLISILLPGEDGEIWRKKRDMSCVSFLGRFGGIWSFLLLLFITTSVPKKPCLCSDRKVSLAASRFQFGNSGAS